MEDMFSIFYDGGNKNSLEGSDSKLIAVEGNSRSLICHLLSSPQLINRSWWCWKVLNLYILEERKWNLAGVDHISEWLLPSFLLSGSNALAVARIFSSPFNSGDRLPALWILLGHLSPAPEPSCKPRRLSCRLHFHQFETTCAELKCHLELRSKATFARGTWPVGPRNEVRPSWLQLQEVCSLVVSLLREFGGVGMCHQHVTSCLLEEEQMSSSES